MRCPKWITAADLDRWAGTPAAKVMLPDVLRRLVFATVPRGRLQRIDFPAGAEAQRPGYDGTTVTTDGTAFVPTGVAFWELGCEVGNCKGKAQGDYEKRIGEHRERLARGETENLMEATFIAVTALDWQKAQEWAEGRAKDNYFGVVRAYDSNSLEQWLQDAPAVGLWLAQEVLGRRGGVTDIATYWADIQATLCRPLAAKVLLVNREIIGTAFDEWLSQPAEILAIRAPSAVELVAVFCAWVQTLSAERQDEISSRAIIVESRDTWEALSTSQQPLILVASQRLEGSAELFASAHRRGHHVLRFAEFRTPRGQAKELPMMRRFDLERTLEETGLANPQARQLAEAAGGNFTILRRRFAKTADLAPWAQDAGLGPLLLAASWEDARPADQRIVSELAQKPYSEVQALMTRWRSESDPPVRFVLGTWEFLSPVDAWEALHVCLTPTQLDRFARLAVEVLSEDNPALELPPEERPMAAIKGKVWRFSSTLRRGIAEILALGATREEESSVGIDLQFAARASFVMRSVLPPGCSWQRWASLGELLPLLTEAAPDAVLEAIEKDIASPHPQLVDLIKQETPGVLTGGVYHSGVLWAQETAAWPRERLQRVALCLARLAKLDPGGTWLNRPLASLTSLFFSWRPQTVASVSERIETLHYLQQKEPEQAWKVILDLLPDRHEVITDNPKPVYRNWAAGWSGNGTGPDLALLIAEVASMAVAMAEADSSRWPALLNHVVLLGSDDLHGVLAALERLAGKPVEQQLRTEVWKKLREIVQRHSRFRGAGWTLPKEELVKFEALRNQFAPTDRVTASIPLFDEEGHIDGGESESFEEKQQRRLLERRQAIRAIWDSGGEASVLELVNKVRRPETVGWSLACEQDIDVAGRIIPTHLTSSNGDIRRFAAAFAYQRIHSNGHDWAEKVPSISWAPEQLAAWALQMPFGPRTWDWVSSHGDAVKQSYWKLTGTWAHPGLDLPARSRAATELQAVERPWSALELLMRAKYEKCALSYSVVCQALEAVAADPTERDSNAMDVHNVHEAFEFLQNCPNEDESRVARLEFDFLPLLDRHSVLPLTLQRELARNSDFFMECLTLLYRPHHRADKSTDASKEQAPDPATAEKAGRIWRLLHEWRVIPGTGVDGKVSLDGLRSWLKSTRQKAREADRLEVCDLTVGEMFAHSPAEADEGTPIIPIREVIEECESEELERGFAVGLHNLRGCFSKSHYEGGKQERELAARFERFAAICARWPRTARVFRGVGQDYLRQAELEDERARTQD